MQSKIPNRREKIVNSLSKLETHQFLLIPHRIGYRCILAAKTDIAKQRLVDAAVWIASEDMRRIWMGSSKKYI